MDTYENINFRGTPLPHPFVNCPNQGDPLQIFVHQQATLPPPEIASVLV